MNEIKIYNPADELILSTLVDDDSYRLREIMGDNHLMLNFSLDYYADIPEDSYCEFKAEQYWLTHSANFEKKHSELYPYRLNMEGSIHFLKKVKLKFFDFILDGAKVKPTSSFSLKFPLTASPRDFGNLLIANLELAYPQYDWKLGDCLESEPVTIDFNHDYCFDLLPKLAEAFDTEWELDKYTLTVGKVEKMKDSAIDLSYGYGNGILAGIERVRYDNTQIINRVYVEGGERNIDRSTYGNDTLLLPKNRLITHEGVDYTTDASGSYIERLTPLAGKEDSLDITKVYPKRVGIVTAVEVIDDKQGFYNIIDADIPIELDYSKHIIAGETMTIIFQTGQVAGKEFDVKYFHDKRKFELVPIDENGLVYPQGHLIPAVGDSYAIFHMDMPEQYIELAEEEALQEAVKYLWENEQAQYSYRWSLDGHYAKQHWGELRGFLNCGFFVKFSDPDFLIEPVDVRITTVRELINDDMKPEITIANKITSKTLGAVINEIPAVEQAVDRKDKAERAYVKRGFRQALETVKMLIESGLEGFDPPLRPIALQSMMALIGSENLQYYYVDNKTNPKRIDSGIDFDKLNKRLVCPVGIIQHRTLGFDGTELTHHTADKYKYWNAKAYQSDELMEAETSYYLYLKCSKTNTADASYILSADSLALDELTNYYHFLVGILNSEEDGDRSWVELFGLTEILPGRINTDRLVSGDGTNYWDFINGVFLLGKEGLGIDYNVTESDTLTLSNATIRQRLNVHGEAFIAGFLFSNQVIRSQVMKGDEHAMVLDGLNGFLQFNNTVERWAENGGTEIKKQYVRIDSSDDAKIEVRNTTDGDVSYMSSQGLYTNRAGINVASGISGYELKAGVVGFGFGKMDKSVWDDALGLVGVYGAAHNSSSNPAPAYGGWFEGLRVNGMYMNVRSILYNVTTRLDKSDVWVSCYNTAQIDIYLPVNPLAGQIIYMRQMNARFRVYTSNIKADIYVDGSLHTWIENRNGIGDTTVMLYDGKHWCLNFMGR